MTNLITKLSEVTNRGALNTLTVNGEKKSIVNVDGYAHYSKSGSDPIRIGETTLYQRFFSITLGNQKRDCEIRIKYKGDTPIRSGDHMTAGIIVNDDGIVSEAAYLALWDLSDTHGRPYNWRGFGDGVEATEEEERRIVFD